MNKINLINKQNLKVDNLEDLVAYHSDFPLFSIFGVLHKFMLLEYKFNLLMETYLPKFAEGVLKPGIYQGIFPMVKDKFSDEIYSVRSEDYYAIISKQSKTLVTTIEKINKNFYIAKHNIIFDKPYYKLNVSDIFDAGIGDRFAHYELISKLNKVQIKT